MKTERIYESLCIHDELSPDFHSLDDCYEGEERPMPGESCSCDNCFYGRNELARSLLDFIKEMDHVERLLSSHIDKNGPISGMGTTNKMKKLLGR